MQRFDVVMWGCKGSPSDRLCSASACTLCRLMAAFCPLWLPSFCCLCLLCRLYCKGVVLGYKRSLRNQYVNQVRIKVQGLEDKKDVDFYLGKRVAYIYKAKTVKKATPTTEGRYRVIWGRIIGPHGNNGAVRAKFRKNLPPTSIGGPVRVMLYPSRI